MNAMQSLTCKAHAVHRACSYRVTGLLIQTYKQGHINDHIYVSSKVFSGFKTLTF